MRRMSRASWMWVVAGLTLAVAVAGFLAVGGVLTLRSPDVPLFGTRWTLVQIGSEAVQPNRAPSVKFGPNGVSGFDGCTTFFAEGAIDATKLRLEPARSALAPQVCPPGFTLPGAFHYALYQAVRATVEGDHMTLHAADGRVLARFRVER